MQKIIIGIVILFAIVVGIYATKLTPEPTEVNINNMNNIDFITLDREMTIAQNLCEERNLTDKIIIIESKYCSACRIAVPRLKEIEEELNKSFVFLDISKKCDRDELSKLKLTPKYTPTVLIGCDVYIGVKPKETYEKLIKNFYNI
ncbi:MAG: thioredoxin family protein [Candidatus Aenigmarchaeota archaeon]|nr:thioredoxin family protein [Candidatus Aenigmarchaeota archaeon]